MRVPISFQRSPYGLTTLEINGPEMDLQIKILSKGSKRERRAILRDFFRHIRPWLRNFREIAIDHSGDGVVRDRRNYERGMRIFPAAPVGTLEASFGSDLRSKRLKLGLTQEEFARQIGIARPHLSAIERGLHFPRPKIRSEIAKLLDEKNQH